MGEGWAQESTPFPWSQCLSAGMRDPGIQNPQSEFLGGQHPFLWYSFGEDGPTCPGKGPIKHQEASTKARARILLAIAQTIICFSPSQVHRQERKGAGCAA